jgi:hypothetical protein
MLTLLTLLPWRWGLYGPSKRWVPSQLHGITTQRTVLFYLSLLYYNSVTSSIIIQLFSRYLFSHVGSEEYCFLGYNAVYSSQSTFRRNISPSTSGSKTIPSKNPACWAYSSILKMEAICSFETSIDFPTDYTALYPTRQQYPSCFHTVRNCVIQTR